jgi:hypothetical protein
MSAGTPYKCTGKIARVRGVSLRLHVERVDAP